MTKTHLQSSGDKGEWKKALPAFPEKVAGIQQLDDLILLTPAEGLATLLSSLVV